MDVTGAVLPNAQIELKPATGTTVQSTADESGTFRIDRVAPGRYDIRVTSNGFEPTTVHITVGNRALTPLRVTMPIARISQEVTVGNTPVEVRKDAASNLDASTVDQKAIENLPVFNQDVLATMSRFLDSSSIGTNGATLVVSGVEVNNLNVSASAIQQIKVNQDPYSAEYPRPGRSRTEVVLKPGSQEYHGTANGIFRDSRLDERNAFAAVKTAGAASALRRLPERARPALREDVFHVLDEGQRRRHAGHRLRTGTVGPHSAKRGFAVPERARCWDTQSSAW